MLHGSFSLDELKRLVKEHDEIMEGYEESGILQRTEMETSNGGDGIVPGDLGGMRNAKVGHVGRTR